MNLSPIKSLVEQHQHLVAIGDVLVYSDACNYVKWTVVDLFDGGFTAQNEEGEIRDRDFETLQYGWKPSPDTTRRWGI